MIIHCSILFFNQASMLTSSFSKTVRFSFPILMVCIFSVQTGWAQPDQTQEVSPDASGVKAITGSDFEQAKKNPATKVKDQERTGTCWSFSTTSLIESQSIKNKFGAHDISEMYTVRCIYLEKAQNYILRQGHTQFSEGALGHDVIRSISTHGAVPESAYSGLTNGEKVYDHEILFKELRKYLDSTLKTKGGILKDDWKPGYNKILDKHLGAVPSNFQYIGKRYTPETYASGILKFNPDDYINITSFTHHPYYKPFILEVPDNFSNGSYYNLPLQEMIDLVTTALNNGYTIMWDADVSNEGFNGKAGLAMNLEAGAQLSPSAKEVKTDAATRQALFENLTTQDDHLMHIVGIEKNKEGTTFFIVKNSWGEVGPYKGHVHVSENYFARNTISLVLPKAAVPQAIMDKLKK